jgi:hypothetical protein
MKRPEAREIHALLRVSDIDEFVVWLRESRDLIYNEMEVTIDTNELHAKRGEARALSTLLNHIKESRTASERLDAQRKAR